MTCIDPEGMADPAASDREVDLVERVEARFRRELDRHLRGRRYGRVVDIIGNQLKVTGVELRVGQQCLLSERGSVGVDLPGEVTAITRGSALVSVLGEVIGLGAMTLVRPGEREQSVPVGPTMLGRVVDAMGEPIDDPLAPLNGAQRQPLSAPPPPAMTRPLIRVPLETGVRAIDAFLTVGRGQRLGIFAPAGAGKSTLLGMIARGAGRGHVCVIALIGERGREVREFLDDVLTHDQRRNTVIVVATSDRPSIERIRAAQTATAIAEYFRDQGQDVLLLCDSVTRLARALRETGLAAGEPPVRRGYPPSVFTALPRLVERAGPAAKGSITAFYTVLLEDAETADPIGEEVRSLLDGHIVLSPQLASAGHYPAIDIRQSVSRLMGSLVAPAIAQAAGRCRDWMARHDDAELLLRIGEYREGGDLRLDSAVQAHDDLEAFLRQSTDVFVPLAESQDQLAGIVRQHALHD